VKPTAQSGGKSAAQPAAPAPVILSYRFPLALRAHQHAALQRILDDQRYLYNRMLERHNFSWMRVKMTEKWVKPTNPELYKEVKRIHNASTGYMSKAGTSRQLTEIRALRDEYRAVSVDLSRGTLQRLDKSHKAFFGRVQKGGPPGYPKFKGARFFNTLEINYVKGFTIKNGRIHVKGVPGGMRIRLHRPLPGKPKALRLTRELNHVKGKAKGKLENLRHKRQMDHVNGKARWWVSFAVEVEGEPQAPGKLAIGVDAGVEKLATCSDGELHGNIRAGRNGAAELRRAQRTLQRRRKVAKQSGKWDSRGLARAKERVRRAHRAAKNRRDNHNHHVANAIVERAGLVVVEKLNVKGMMAKGGARKKGLNRSLADASMRDLLTKLEYKSARAGVGFEEVPPHYTSQQCSRCGVMVKKELNVRHHWCPSCGEALDRDVNAARNILKRGLQQAKRKEGETQ